MKKWVEAHDFSQIKVVDKITEDLPTGLYVVPDNAENEDSPVPGYPILHLNVPEYSTVEWSLFAKTIDLILTSTAIFMKDSFTPTWFVTMSEEW